MKLGILGTGLIAHEVLPMLEILHLEKLYILGTEHSVKKTQKLCETYRMNGCFFNYDEMLDADIDTIYIALPNHLHFSFAKKALEKNKHVILEKPITVTLNELQELAQIAREKHLILVEAMSLHHTPAYRSIREKISDLGEIKLVNFQFCQYSSRYDAFKEGKIAPAFDPKCAGGALMDLNIYNLHAIIGLFGKPRAAHYLPNMERGIDTSGILTLDYGDFKAVAVAAKDCQAPVSSTIQGNKGCIRIQVPMNQIESYELFDNQKNGTTYDFHENAHRLSYEFLEFDRMIREKDFKKAEELMQISMTATEILEHKRPYQMK